MTRKRLFVLGNPTHYLNAVEYAYQFPDAENHLVAITPYAEGFRAIDKLGGDRFWRSRQVVDRRKQSFTNDVDFWSFCNDLLGQWLQKVHPKELVLGNLADSMMYPFLIKHKDQFDSCVILDDGTPTLNIFALRLNRLLYRSRHLSRPAHILKTWMAFKVLMPFRRSPRQLSFFSLFKGPVSSNDRLIPNEFAWIKSQVKSFKPVREMLFVGSHIVDRGLVSKAAYFQSLELISSQAEEAGLDFIYVHHRGESEEIKKMLQDTYKTRLYDRPLEFVYIKQASPMCFAGHFSSALFNLAAIYPAVQSCAYLFPESMVYGSTTEPKDYLMRVQQELAVHEKILAVEWTNQEDMDAIVRQLNQPSP